MIRSRWRCGVLLAVVLVAACRANPEATKARHLQRGDAFLSQGQIVEAIIEYRGAVQIDPRSGETRMKLAQTYLQNNDARNAFGEFIRAADLMPANLDAQMKAGHVLILAGRFDDARRRAEAVLALEPRNVAGQILLGNALAGLKDIDGAIGQIEGAIRDDPSRSLSYASLGALLQFARGDAGQAETAFKNAIAADPKSVEARLALANLYWATNRRSQAEQELMSILEFDPRNLIANRALALFYLGANRPAEAERPLKILADDRSRPDGLVALADYYVSRQRVADAKTVLQEAAALPGAAVTATLRLAALRSAEGDKAGAYRLIGETLAKEPARLDGLVAQAMLQLDDLQLGEALVTSRKAVAAHPASPQAHYVHGQTLAANGQIDEAVAAHSAALRLNPSFVQSNVALARLAIQSGKPGDASLFAQAAVTAMPGYAEAHLLLARALLMKGDAAAAEAPLKLLSDNFPQNPVIRAEVGRLMLVKNDRIGARAVFERLLDAEPAQLSALEGLATLELQARHPEAVHRRLDAALAAAPAYPALHVLAARLYMAMGDHAKAERWLRQAMTTDAGNLDSYKLLARLYAKQRRLPEATAEMQKLAARLPMAVGPPTTVALLLEIQKKTDEAVSWYEKVLALDPTAAVAANNLAMIYADRNGDLDTALRLARVAKAALPGAPEVDDTMGWIFFKKNLTVPAIASLKQSVAAEPENPIYLYHLGLAYAQYDDVARARENLEKALKIQPAFEGADEARRVLAAQPKPR